MFLGKIFLKLLDKGKIDKLMADQAAKIIMACSVAAAFAFMLFNNNFFILFIIPFLDALIGQGLAWGYEYPPDGDDF